MKQSPSFPQTILELEERFGAVSSETQIIQGRWRSEAGRFTDTLIRIYVDAEATDEVREFFLRLKENLKSRFAQLDIWITSYSIEVL